MHFQFFVGVLCLSLFCYILLCVHSSFVIILKREGKLVALLLMSYISIGTVNVWRLFLTLTCVGLQCVIVIFFHHTHLVVKQQLDPGLHCLLYKIISSNPNVKCRPEASISKNFYYIPITDTTLELSVFWPSDTESRINELRFSESISLSFKTRLTSVTCFCGDVT